MGKKETNSSASRASTSFTRNASRRGPITTPDALCATPIWKTWSPSPLPVVAVTTLCNKTKKRKKVKRRKQRNYERWENGTAVRSSRSCRNGKRLLLGEIVTAYGIEIKQE